jgi:predicted alpha/beta-fold hydrolase
VDSSLAILSDVSFAPHDHTVAKCKKHRELDALVTNDESEIHAALDYYSDASIRSMTLA